MKTFTNTYRTTRNLWAMKAMSLTNSKPVLAKGVVVGITAANFAVGLYVQNRLKAKGRTGWAKAIEMLNSLSLGINAVDTYEICKEIDKLAGKDVKQTVDLQAAKDLEEDSDIMKEMKDIFGENIGCTDGTCDMCKAFEKAGVNPSEDPTPEVDMELTLGEIEPKRS